MTHPETAARPQGTGRGDLRLAALTGAVLAAALGIGLQLTGRAAPDVVSADPVLLLALLAVAFAAAESAVVYVPLGRQAVSLTLNEIPLAVGLFVLPPVPLVAVRVLAAVVPIVLRTRASTRKVVFTLAHYSLEATLLIVVWHATLGTAAPLSPRGWLALGVAFVAVDLLGLLLISLAIAATTGARPRVDADLLGLGPVPALVSATFALTLVYVLSVDWRATWTLGVFVAVLFFAQRGHQVLRRRTASLEKVSTFTGEMGAHLDVDSAAAAAVSFVAQALGADVVELALRPEFAGRARSFETGFDGSLRESSGPTRAPHLAPWLVGSPLLVRRRPADPALAGALRRARLHDAMVLPLRGDAGDIGTLLVGNRLGAPNTFEVADLRDLQALGNHLAVALQNARRADLIRDQAVDALHRSRHDLLTGLPNRVQLEACLAEQGEAGAEHSLVLLNLDRFKEINDALGHTAGDVLLGLVAARLRAAAPEAAVLARVGGDEYAVLLPGADSAAVLALVAVLRHGLSVPFEIEGLMVTVGASFGVTTAGAGASATDVLRRADIAMSAAKERRTGVEAYRSDLDAGSRDRLTMLTELRAAISDGSLTVWVQPKVNLRDGQVTGVEALVRWQHPERGTIFPDDFIPVAEHSGLITPLTMTVLRQSLRACAAWRSAGHDLAIAVNLSPRSLLEADFVDEVARDLAAVDVPASALTFEITESSLMADPERAILALGRLRDLGVRLSIDDLGTGYSSLAYLQRLPVDEIKIDRSFLLRADEAAGDQSVAIIGAIVDLGHRLGCEVVAEGVEDEASWRILRALGCDSAQGYWMSRPMPEAGFLPWLAQWQPGVTPATRLPRPRAAAR